MDPQHAADVAARHLRPGTLSLSTLPPLALYVHLPWCLKKCPYCDFNSHEVTTTPRLPSVAAPQRGSMRTGESGSGSLMPSLAGRASAPRELPESAYLDALCADLEAALPLIWGRRIGSVFIGGGTPSLFSPASIERLLGDIRARLMLEPGCEITLEANPGTFEAERFKAYRAAGVTRLSIGVQSFDDAALQRIGRVHDAAQARAAVAEAREAFDTFNIDLMYALPQQTLDELRRDLETALSFEPPHLSIYHLTLEPNTWFATHPPELPDEDLASDMLDLIAQRTAEVGLARYEVSAFARSGHRSRHNLNYWQFGDYLGIGAGAHSKLSFAHRVIRQVRWREPARYMQQVLQGAAVSNEDEVRREALTFEFMLNALRLREGFEMSDFAERTGLLPSAAEPGLLAGEQRGLLSLQRDAIGRITHAQPTVRGFDFLSDLQSMFLADGK